MGRLFGTDGVRGVANQELTAELALALGRPRPAGWPPPWPADASRSSAATRAPAGDAGSRGDRRVTSEGVDAPAGRGAAHPGGLLTAAYGADFGVMISASQPGCPTTASRSSVPAGTSSTTPPRTASRSSAQGPGLRPVGPGIGRLRDAADALERHLRHVGTAAATRLDGITVVVDCANGAASSGRAAGSPRRGRAGDRDQRRTGRPGTSTTAADRRT